tara:strand:+ start:48 stop:629 length:582 start_codon:yes stop_codon:yes gene_type:complete
MEVINIETPWPHFEVKHFLTADECSLVKENFKVADTPCDSKPITKHFAIKLRDYKIMESRFMELLDQLDFNFDKDTMKFTCMCHQLAPNAVYKIHNDAEKKIVSFVLHISEQANGTKLYDKDQVFVKETGWHFCGGAGFLRDEHTWHSFDNLNNTKVRQTILMNIIKIDPERLETLTDRLMNIMKNKPEDRLG